MSASDTLEFSSPAERAEELVRFLGGAEEQTLAGLDERHRRIITAPWELDWPLVEGAVLRRVTRAA